MTSKLWVDGGTGAGFPLGYDGIYLAVRDLCPIFIFFVVKTMMNLFACRNTCLVLVGMVCWGALSPLSAQNLFHQKDLAFAQVAGGPGFETVLTVTNRGSWDYVAKLKFRRGAGELWNPLVNGVPASQGEVSVVVKPDQVSVLRITEEALTSGAAYLVSDDLLPDNFVEANLTYNLRSGETIVDSVGVFPSAEFYLTSLPFDDFGSVALALANPDLGGGVDTELRITLLDDQGAEVATARPVLASQGHLAQFLFEIFGSVPVTRGKIEIASGLPIVGTALILKQGQLSSLPLAAAPVGYSVEMRSDGGAVFEGLMGLWTEGFFVRGYLVLQKYEGADLAKPEVTLVNGQLIDGFLDLSFFGLGEAFFNEEITLYMAEADFSLFDQEAEGAWVMMFLSDLGVLEGTFTLRRTTP